MGDEPEKRPNIDLDLIAKFINDWDRIQADRESALGEYRGKCAGFKESEKRLKGILKKEGVGPKAFARIIKQRKLLGELEKLRDDEDMASEDIETAEMVLEKIGEDFASFGLGAAAIDKAKEREEAQSRTVDSITDDWDDAAPVDNGAGALAKGIKPLVANDV